MKGRLVGNALRGVPRAGADIVRRVTERHRGRSLRRWLVLCAVPIFLAGCGPDVDTTYGKQKTVLGEKSVNGTSVLADMFRASGHRVSRKFHLSPKLWERADVIVWFPDDYTTTSQPARDWLENWLFDKPGRTLIFVGRDFDAAPGYWEKMKAGAPAEQSAEINRRLAEARSATANARGPLDPTLDYGWFRFDTQLPPRHVYTLRGDPAWLAGIDPAQAELELNARLVMPFQDDIEVQLSSEGDTLVARQDFDDSQLIVVANGSFLLNLPLVNREHRKLAGSLIRAVGQDRHVYFLETGGDPAILDKEPEADAPTALALLGYPPWGIILLHLALLGLVFCFGRFPIFGLPKRLPDASRSDFGEHVAALGELLAKTNDRAYAEARLAHYQQTVHPDTSGVRAAMKAPTDTPPPLPSLPQPAKPHT